VDFVERFWVLNFVLGGGVGEGIWEQLFGEEGSIRSFNNFGGSWEILRVDRHLCYKFESFLVSLVRRGGHLCLCLSLSVSLVPTSLSAILQRVSE